MEKRVPGIADKSMKEGYFMKMKRVLSAGLIGAMALSTLAFTGCGSNSGDGSGGDTNFSWWIYSTDGQ